jgi:TPR repeat protein
VRVAFPLQILLGAVLLAHGPACEATEPGSTAASVTECDRLAAHPSDPDKATPGVPTSEVKGWNESAIWACRQAVARSPDDPRQRYQLGRALFYAGQQAEALRHLAVSASGTHRQAQFVLGLMYTDGVPDVLEPDACKALALWQDAASRGHYAARVALGRDWVRGRYLACPDAPTAEQVDAWLVAARSESKDYYQRLLIDWARESLATGT